MPKEELCEEEDDGSNLYTRGVSAIVLMLLGRTSTTILLRTVGLNVSTIGALLHRYETTTCLE